MELYIPIILLLMVSVFLFYNLYRYRKDRSEYFESLGARIVKYSWFLNPIGELEWKGQKIQIQTSGPKGMHRLQLILPLNPLGYFQVRKRSLGEGFFLKSKFNDYTVEYEDPNWAKRLLQSEQFTELIKKLFKEASLTSLKIKDRKLLLEWAIRFSPKEVERERVLLGLDIGPELKNFLDKLPSAHIYKENLRSWLTFKLPFLVTFTLSIIGTVGGFYKYQPLCFYEIILVGYKLLLPVELIYVILVVLWVGKSTIWLRVGMSTLFVCLVSNFFLSLFFLTFVNGYLDTSSPEIKRDVVIEKYSGLKRKHRILLEELHKDPWCDSMKVSKEFYLRVEKRL